MEWVIKKIKLELGRLTLPSGQIFVAWQREAEEEEEENVECKTLVSSRLSLGHWFIKRGMWAEWQDTWLINDLLFHLKATATLCSRSFNFNLWGNAKVRRDRHSSAHSGDKVGVRRALVVLVEKLYLERVCVWVWKASVCAFEAAS